MFHLVWAADGYEDWSNHCRTGQWFWSLFGLVIEALTGFEGTFAFPSQLQTNSGLVRKRQNSFLIECGIRGERNERKRSILA